MAFKNFQLIRFIVILVFMLSASWPTQAETFECYLHDGESVVEITEPLFLGSPKISIKKIPSGKLIKATIVDYGDGWVLFDDGWGWHGEGKNVCELTNSQNHGKSGPHCGALRKYFKYAGVSDHKSGRLLVKKFTIRDCMRECTYYSAGDRASNGYCYR